MGIEVSQIIWFCIGVGVGVLAVLAFAAFMLSSQISQRQEARNDDHTGDR